MADHPDRCNILLVILDQLAAQALRCYDGWIPDTPAIDRLAADGLRFDRAYTTYPLCQPARVSFWTGRHNHQTGVTSNGRLLDAPTTPMDVPTVGSLLSQAGYRCVHVGKRHDAGSLRGFEHHDHEAVRFDTHPGFPCNQDTWQDEGATRAAEAFLRDPGADPFCCVVDLNNPHNICGWVGENAERHGHLPIPEPLPELPPNHRIDDLATRPLPVQYICCAHNRQAQAADFDERTWRQYRAAYAYYTQLADRMLQRVLDALAAGGHGDDTTVILMADHGDGMGCHGHATKHTSFYDQTTRVPLIVSGAGVERRGSHDGLVSLIDLLPTLCGIAGAPVPEHLPGIDLGPAWRGDTGIGHDYVVAQWYSEWGFTVEPGRMLRTPRWKYMRYREGDGEEFYDLEADPWERHNRIADPACAEALQHHRDLLEAYCADSGDPFFHQEWKADTRWRSHPLGYDRHTGPAAPQAS